MRRIGIGVSGPGFEQELKAEGAQSKFSTTAYSAAITGATELSIPELSDRPHRIGQKSDFEGIVEEIRSFLVSTKGNTEEERSYYNETLNRAILGFTDDREKLLAIINDQLTKKRIHNALPGHSKFSSLAEAIFAEVIGLSVLELIIKNRGDLEEIQVVGIHIFEVRQGIAAPSPYRFQSIKEVERIQQNLVLFNSETLNPRKKWAEVMLRDGSRVTLTGFGYTAEPTMTIRFFVVKHFNLQMLCRPEYETMDEYLSLVIQSIIHSYFNMVVIGPTNSGKTNLIKAIIAEMPDQERIITIESRFELMLKRDFPDKNIIEYEVDEEDVCHSGEQAFKLALRQSPKRICHAEIRDRDANNYVRACTRGHEGSITSVHVNELEDVPDAIADMCMMDGRSMNPLRLTKRITEYVTQIGIEMGVVNGRRKIVRLGEYEFVDGEVHVREIVAYNHITQRWDIHEKFSQEAGKRFIKHDRDKFAALLALGLVEPCT
ncbi:MAG TPA: ATPase, T2SS/T4P/T4SS family [Bacilli bacterium]